MKKIFQVNTSGTVSCAQKSLDTVGKILKLSQCSGDGKLQVNHGNQNSDSILINNNENVFGSANELLSPVAVVLSSDEATAYVIDKAERSLFQVNVSNGNRQILSK